MIGIIFPYYDIVDDGTPLYGEGRLAYLQVQPMVFLSVRKKEAWR